METRDLVEIIRKIIIEETKYMRNYLGKVVDNNDIDQKGKILVTIPALIWNTNDKGCWCTPIDKRALITPAIGDWVVVTFESGDSTKPYYLGNANNIKDVIPKSFDGLPATQVLYEADENNKIVYDENKEELTIKINKTIDINQSDIKIDKTSDKLTTTISNIDINNGVIKIDPANNITFNSGIQPFVLGTILDTWFTSVLLTIFNAHTHTCASPGSPSAPPSSPLTPPVNYLSTQIKGM